MKVMKKLIAAVLISMAIASCSATSTSEDTQMLQSKYIHVYNVDGYSYICFDSVHAYHVRVTIKGNIHSIVKIK